MSRSLKNIYLKKSYDPSIDGSNVINDFYIPCLSVSTKYDRCSAYFSSAVLKQFAKGLSEFYKNNGHARFIFSCQISEEEMNNIIDAYRKKMDDLSDTLDCSLNDDYEIANLGFLIKNNLAEVKIAFMIKDKSALMHMKSGLFTDSIGNKVYFDGSGNETEYGITKNAEIFNVFTNFDGSDYYLQNGEIRFNRLWDNTYSPTTIRTEFPIGKLFEKLKSYSRDKIFKSQEEFFYHEECVYIDIDLDKQLILLKDYSKNNLLKMPMILKSYYRDKISSIGDTLWFVESLTLHDIRDIIPSRITKYGNKVVYSKNAWHYISTQDLKIDKRIKLAESIKTNQNKNIWTDDFFKFKNIIDFEMSARLKEQQYINAYHHYSMKSSMDFSVPGTGKTFISYGLFAYLYSTFQKKQDVNHLVVIGPLNCFKAWKEECKMIFATKHNFTIFDITEHHDDFEKQVYSMKYHIYLFNYEFLNPEKIKVIANLILDDKTMLVFDEIHKLKSLNGIRANNVMRMLNMVKKKPIYKLALTGTPLPNSYKDLYNYLRILYSDDLNGFLNVFSVNQLNQADSNVIYANEIQKNLHPLFMRTTKKDLNIPAANPDNLDRLCIEPTKCEKDLYKLIHKAYKNPLLKFIRLIQASSNPNLILSNVNIGEIQQLYDDDFASNFNFGEDTITKEDIYADKLKNAINQINISSKTKATIDFIVEKVKNNEKIIVWCLFIGTIDLVKNELANQGIESITICGRDGVNERDRKIDEFKYTNTNVLITNPNTLAESVSLHIQCHNAVYLEYGFNLTYLLQSKDRIHRVGLKERTETNYYFAVSKAEDEFSSIDERIYKRLQQKSVRMQETVESNNIVLLNDTSDIDDIKFILNIK